MLHQIARGLHRRVLIEIVQLRHDRYVLEVVHPPPIPHRVAHQPPPGRFPRPAHRRRAARIQLKDFVEKPDRADRLRRIFFAHGSSFRVDAKWPRRAFGASFAYIRRQGLGDRHRGVTIHRVAGQLVKLQVTGAQFARLIRLHHAVAIAPAHLFPVVVRLIRAPVFRRSIVRTRIRQAAPSPMRRSGPVLDLIVEHTPCQIHHPPVARIRVIPRRRIRQHRIQTGRIMGPRRSFPLHRVEAAIGVIRLEAVAFHGNLVQKVIPGELHYLAIGPRLGLHPGEQVAARVHYHFVRIKRLGPACGADKQRRG